MPCLHQSGRPTKVRITSIPRDGLTHAPAAGEASSEPKARRAKSAGSKRKGSSWGSGGGGGELSSGASTATPPPESCSKSRQASATGALQSPEPLKRNQRQRDSLGNTTSKDSKGNRCS
mmetsp:Transcript_97691/g.271863  ORF Transcript_97691/g.271863 Transcript_97691/m.271863 type:complete len:119 (+) Transcript_97691:20-376(+)